MASLPWAANSGQWRARGASRSKVPASARWSTRMATTPFDAEKMACRVSGPYGRAEAASAIPPHRSATTAPRRQTHTAALAAVGEIALEGVDHGLEAGFDVAGDHGVGDPLHGTGLARRRGDEPA